MREQNRCEECGKETEVYELHKCPNCHKHICEACAYVVGGVNFCCKNCSEYFFFGDGDETE